MRSETKLSKKKFNFIQVDLYLQQVKKRTKLKDEIYILKSEAMLKDGKFKFHSWLNNIKKVEYVEYSNQTINM